MRRREVDIHTDIQMGGGAGRYEDQVDPQCYLEITIYLYNYRYTTH